MEQKGLGTGVIIGIAVAVVVVVVVAVVAVVLMGGSGTPSTTTITGSVVKGSVTGASVEVWALNPDGTKGDLLGIATTDSTGSYTISLDSAQTGQLLVEAFGGYYVNETTGATDTLSAFDNLTAVLPAGTTQAAVTPLTHMAAARARAMAAEGIPLTTAVDVANVGVAQQYNLSDILGVLPVDANNATQMATASSEQRLYGIVLAGITQEAENLNVRPMDLVAALATDMEDGTLGSSSGSTIQVPTITGSVITLPSDAGTEAMQTSINTFLASGNNLTNLTGTSISATPVNINPAGGSFYITATALPAWTEGQSGSATLTANGGTTPYTWTVTAGSALPSWLVLAQQGNNAVLTGTAPLLDSGTTRSISSPFSVTCTDSTGLAQAISWTVTIVKATPQLETRTITVTAGVHFSEKVATASGGVPPCYVFACPAETPLGSIMNLDGTLSGTIVTPGTYTFETDAVDAIGSTYRTTVTVIVTPSEESTESSGVSQFDGYYTGSFSGDLSGSAAFTVSNGVITVTDPGGGSGSVSASGSTSFSGAGGYEGATYSFSGTFVVSSGTASASGTWTGSYMGISGSGTWSATRQ